MNNSRLAKIGGVVVLLLIVVPFVIHAVPELVGAEHSFVVLSGSMMPAINPGDSVIVEQRDPSTIQEGDVITFTQSGNELPTTHRVIGVEQRNDGLVFQTKGDANDDPDPTAVPESNLLGAVLLTIPFIGYVIQFANTPLGFVVLVGVPLGVLAITEIRSLSTEQRTASSTAESTAHSVANDTTAEADGTVPDDPTETMTTDTDRTTADESPTSADSQVNHRDEDSVATDTEPATVVIQPHDMTATIGLLALIVPYSIYVAVQLQNTLTFSVMFGSTFLLIAAGWLWLAGRESVSTAVDTIQQTSTTSDLSSEQTATDSSIEEGD